MSNFAKKLVSKKKRRFQEDGFDLDLTFITKNVVAMGFPSEGTEGMYRNHMKDVRKFFDSKYKDHYKVYNLCSERDYDPDKFYGRVAKYPFDDHNAPPFVLMEPFCKDVTEYLQDKDNVAVIHCKAGKGRTGVMICALLLHTGMFTSPEESLNFYGHARTKNGKGVTIPSQTRFVHYYGQYLQEGKLYRATTKIFKTIKLIGIPKFSGGTCVPYFTIRQGPNQVLVYKSKVWTGITRDQSVAVLNLDPPSPLCGDVKVEFFHKTATGKDKMFNVWFNTFFIKDNAMTAPKRTVDKANKDKKHKVFPENFEVEFTFESLEGESELYDAQNTRVVAEQEAILTKGAGIMGTGSDMTRMDSSKSPSEDKWDDADLTTDDEDDEEDEWEGLPITDV
eukprot:m.93393 g.93393  ORF g.93393 m.93393 type:complete len:392 (-) comp26629_c0_seq1:392-1567(-)